MMKKSTTSDRLNQLMKDHNLKQVDILKMCKPFCKKYEVKLERNDLSQYVSGKTEPGQKKLMVLAEALNVSPVWLMGLDVPMERNNNISRNQYDEEIEKIALEHGGTIYIDKKEPLTANDVVEINKILMKIIDKDKNNKSD